MTALAHSRHAAPPMQKMRRLLESALAGHRFVRIVVAVTVSGLAGLVLALAPRKRLVWFEQAGHSTAFEEFRRFERLMTDVVLPQTYEKEGPR